MRDIRLVNTPSLVFLRTMIMTLLLSCALSDDRVLSRTALASSYAAPSIELLHVDSRQDGVLISFRAKNDFWRGMFEGFVVRLFCQNDDQTVFDIDILVTSPRVEQRDRKLVDKYRIDHVFIMDSPLAYGKSMDFKVFSTTTRTSGSVLCQYSSIRGAW